VLQEAFLFSDTVMNNLKYAREGATDEECIAAAKEANAHDFIMQLPQGYDTVLTERGANLSQGQRQMLTIARAMVANPKLLILDEATSNVDTRTEKLIQEGLLRLMAGKTSFVIAHRLSTIRDSARILAIKDGVIVEQGTHDELMRNQGLYYDLYKTQFRVRPELELLTRLPAAIGFAVMIAERADWRGRRTEIRELRAAAAKTAPQYAGNPLVQQVAPQVSDLLESDDLVQRSRDKNASVVLTAVAAQCAQAAGLLAAKATPAEAEGYKRFALGLGIEAAEAHADAEFFGIGGQTVSRNERRALDELREALGLAR
jgi:ABC-type multidrug transport system ATPase subunit